jgi:hypothetical protein
MSPSVVLIEMVVFSLLTGALQDIAKRRKKDKMIFLNGDSLK